MWHKWKTEKPLPGKKIITVSDWGASCLAAWVTRAKGKYQTELDIDLFHAEDGESLHGIDFTLWAYLPDDYPIQFMELTEADWY